MRTRAALTGTGKVFRAGRFIAGAALALASMLASADVQQIVGTPTTMVSTADRMISYRCQSHSWQTADGATHLMVNRGPGRKNQSLMLYSTFDGGTTWVPSNVTLPGSNGSTTSDGYLVGNTLYVTYDVGTGTIRYAELTYDPAAQAWSLTARDTVFTSDVGAALTPALAADALGRQWLTFTYQDKATGDFSLKMMRKAKSDPGWVDTGFVFGAVDSISNERSGRPIATSRGIGVVFTVHADTYWAERADEWPLDAQWPRALIYTKQGPMNDPYGTHFSVVADSAFNMHMVSGDAGQVVYSRYLVADRQWTTVYLTDSIKATYMQATLVNDKLSVVTNSYTNLSVYQSNDGGDTFVRTHALTHPAPTGKISYDRPRVETPSYSTSPIPVLQQYTEGKINHLMFFAVTPVTGDAPVVWRRNP